MVDVAWAAKIGGEEASEIDEIRCARGTETVVIEGCREDRRTFLPPLLSLSSFSNHRCTLFFLIRSLSSSVCL